MSKTVTAAIYETHGIPAHVLRLVEQEWPRARADEVVVQMLAAPVNPADLNAIEGKYPVRPPLPATPGMEGAGLIAQVGRSVKHIGVGQLVLLPHNFGTWRQAAAVRADAVVPVPEGIDAIQAAMVKINPITAWRMLHDFVKLEPGGWLIQNAANSGAGRAVIQIAKELGWKTVNVVRRAELIEELRAEGADIVVVDGEELRDAVKEQTSGAPIRLALNAVGGDNALRVAGTLASDATMVTYGAMSLQPMKIPNGMLIFKNLCFTGFWVNKWYDAATAEQRAQTFKPLFDMARRGLLRSKVEKTYPLAEVREAVADAARGMRGGKVMLDLRS
ncbi:MAG: MDR family NADPH-dependent oxidoreductase [Chthoniobacterales bacterium]